MRVWEKRYGIILPSRTETNIRYYTNQDLIRILNIAFLKKSGIRISAIAALTPAELTALVTKLGCGSCDEQRNVDRLLAAMIDLDEKYFNTILDQCINQLGFEHAMEKVAYPFFKRIGFMWQTGAVHPGQEHFVSNLIRQKIISATPSPMMQSGDACKTFVLFLPEGELHELGLLFYNYLIRKAGCVTIYLGQNMPIEHVVQIVGEKEVDVIVTACLSLNGQEASHAFLQSLTRHFAKSTIVVINRMNVDNNLLNNKRIILNHSVQAFKEKLGL